MLSIVDPLRSSADLVVRAVELGMVGVSELARLGSDVLLATVLARLVRTNHGETADSPLRCADVVTDAEVARDVSPAELVAGGLLFGEGRYTRREVAERADGTVEVARRLWRAVGFPDVDDDQRVFTSADVDALGHAIGLLEAGIVDVDALVDLVRPVGNLMSRLAAAQTSFLSEVLGARMALRLAADYPQLPGLLASQAVVTTQELLPVLEFTTRYVWRRHLAAEIERTLILNKNGVVGDSQSRPAAVCFVDISGFTRLSRGIELAELAGLLDRFETAVLDGVVTHGGRVIKNLGDEILFVSDDPVSAAQAVLHLVGVFATDETLPAIHAGLAFGSVLFRGGDVYGPVVNIAARLASLAGRGTIRVDQAMAAELKDFKQFTLSARPPRHVKGYLHLSSYRLRLAGHN